MAHDLPKKTTGFSLVDAMVEDKIVQSDNDLVKLEDFFWRRMAVGFGTSF